LKTKISVFLLDKQNERAKSLSQDIERHEKMVEDIKGMLSQQEEKLAEISLNKDGKICYFCFFTITE